MNEFLLYLNFAGILFLFILVWPQSDKRSAKKKREDAQIELEDYMQKEKEEAEARALHVQENKEQNALRDYRNSKKIGL